MSVVLAGVKLKNPVIPVSGTFGFGHEYAEFYDLSILGGVAAKGITPEPREGNPPPRIAETPSGILNCVGLQNPGADAFIREELPFMRRFDTAVIANISGNTVSEFTKLAEKLDGKVDIIEVNVSCPNIHAGGAVFGADCSMVEEITREIKNHVKTPVFIKLSPNVTDITGPAKAAECAGADGISMINTLLGMRIDIERKKPLLGNTFGGLSGPAVLPVALRMVWQVYEAVKIPIIGMGGVSSGREAAEMMMAGAAAVGVGSAILRDPFAPVKIISELEEFIKSHGIASVRDLTGAAH